MKHKIFAITAFAGALMVSGHVFAQSTAGVDPACLMKGADGTEMVDKAKCPDGMTLGADAGASTTTAPAADTTASTSPAMMTLIVPPGSFDNANVISANDFIGKRVYSRAGDDIGEVNDIILTDGGSIQAVVLGVGGFLGMGEKDVAVSMASIDRTRDGENVKLVVDGTKEQFAAAPSYDRKTRTYLK